MVLLMKMEKYSVKIGLGYFAVSTKTCNAPSAVKFTDFVFSKIMQALLIKFSLVIHLKEANYRLFEPV